MQRDDVEEREHIQEGISFLRNAIKRTIMRYTVPVMGEIGKESEIYEPRVLDIAVEYL